jgi:hypothetical protein
MRDVTPSIEQAWKSGHAVGDLRPIARVTVQHPKMRLRNFPMKAIFAYKKVDDKTDSASLVEGDFIDWSKQMKVNQCYADYLFSGGAKVREIRNIRSISWTRSVDQEVADCTIEVWNGGHTPINSGSYADELSNPGYYTPNRGGSSFSAQWHQERNEYFGLLMPDNIIRTYEGYGDSDTVPNLNIPPELDQNLVQTGTWIIDSVTMSESGQMSIKCRDLGRILLDQMFIQPVVPKDFWHYDWVNWGEPPKVANLATKLKVKAQDSSNTPWIGNSLTHNVAGHKLQHAFDGDPSTYWLSIGNDRPSRRFAYEWVQCSVNNQTVSEVRFRARKKGYTAYISVKTAAGWQGVKSINYHEDGIGQNGADIKYVKTTVVDTESWVTVKFKAIAKVQAVRVTFGNLQDFRIGTYHYRAGIRDVEVYSPGTTTAGKVKKGPAGSNPGKYNDYTDIIKLLCGWAGFFWPKGGHQRDCLGNFHTVSPLHEDPVLGRGTKGRIWGDFQDTNSNGPVPLSFDTFDKKTLMDAIISIRDTLGFLFYIDELGSVQWRLPNRFDRGNWRTTLSDNPGRTKQVVTIDEKRTLITLSATLSSANVREAFFVGVANALLEDGGTEIGAYAPGFNPNPTGLRRIAGWTDSNFTTQAEAELMADMLSLAHLFRYRTDRVRIQGYPKIQIDDQVRLLERTTSEGHLHYVRSISSTLDVTSGEYYYDLETMWLGEDPKAVWLFKPEQLYHATAAQLQVLKNTPAMDGPTRKWQN